MSRSALSFEAALTCLDEVPAVLREREKSMAYLRRKVIEVIASEGEDLLEQICAEGHGNVKEEEGDVYDEEAAQERAAARDEKIRQGMDALVKILGPVNAFFSDMCINTGGRDRFGFGLDMGSREDVMFLPWPVMQLLLGHDVLQLRSENEAYLLLLAYWGRNYRTFKDREEDGEEDPDEILCSLARKVRF